jgi:hypothetical protein
MGSLIIQLHCGGYAGSSRQVVMDFHKEGTVDHDSKRYSWLGEIAGKLFDGGVEILWSLFFSLFDA